MHCRYTPSRWKTNFIWIRINCLATERLCVKEPVLAHWAKQMYKINYWNQYTIDAVQSFTFFRRTREKVFLITVIKTSLLICTMEGMWPKLALTTHERESCLWALRGGGGYFARSKDFYCTCLHSALGGGGGKVGTLCECTSHDFIKMADAFPHNITMFRCTPQW